MWYMADAFKKHLIERDELMKIGIISINIHTKTLNFGCIIHSCAFQHFLRENGFDSEVIEYKPIYYKDFDVRHPLFSYIDNEEESHDTLVKWRDLFYEREIRFDKFFAFVDKYYKKTDKCYTADSLDTEDPGFDCYICATDVIWKAVPGGPDKGYLLACDSMKGKKKIAYSASKGTRKYTEAQEKKFINAVSDFDYIFVREGSLKDYMNSVVDLDVPVVLDPVFLMTKSFYESLEIEPEKKYENYILIYMAQTMDDSFVQKVIEFANSCKLPVIELSESVNHRGYESRYGHDFIYDVGVEEWLWYIHHAEYIFTNSFHGTCLSIIYNKQFFDGARGGDKIEFLLERFGLHDRWLSEDNFVDAMNKEDIDYVKVNSILDEARAESSKLIIDALKDVESHEHRPLIENPESFVERSHKRRQEENNKPVNKAKKLVKKLLGRK